MECKECQKDETKWDRVTFTENINLDRHIRSVHDIEHNARETKEFRKSVERSVSLKKKKKKKQKNSKNEKAIIAEIARRRALSGCTGARNFFDEIPAVVDEKDTVKKEEED